MIRVLFVNDILEGGGAERAMATLINTLAVNHPISIQLALLEKGIGFPLPKEVKIHFLSTKKLPPNYEKFKNLFTQALAVKQIVKREKIDLVISFQFRSNFTNLISRILGSNAKVIISERAYAKNFYKRPGVAPKVNQFLIRKLYPKADLIIANSQDIKTGLIDYYGIKPSLIKVINNGYPKDEIISRSREPIPEWDELFEPTDQVLINVGRVEWEKGQEYLLEALHFLKKSPQIKVLFLGLIRKEYKKILDDIIQKYGIQNQVKFKGYVSNPYPWLARSSVFTFTSLFEGYPNALAEALILEKPLVSFDIKAGVRDIIQCDKQGYLVPFGEVEAYSQAIKKALLINEVDSYHILEAKESAENYFLSINSLF